MDTENIGLLPCPFCGSTNIDPAEWSGNDGKSGPGCGNCGALAESAELWNQRVAPAALHPAQTIVLSDLKEDGTDQAGALQDAIDLAARLARHAAADLALARSAAPAPALADDELADLDAVLSAVADNDAITAAAIRKLYPVGSALRVIEKLRKLAAQPAQLEAAQAEQVPMCDSCDNPAQRLPNGTYDTCPECVRFFSNIPEGGEQSAEDVELLRLANAWANRDIHNAEEREAALLSAIAASRRAPASEQMVELRARVEEITDTNIKNVAENLHLKKRVRELETQIASPASDTAPAQLADAKREWEADQSNALACAIAELEAVEKERDSLKAHLGSGASAPDSSAQIAKADAEVPTPCDSNIHQKGAVVAVMDCGMLAMEGLVKEANRKYEGMDWHYFGGRAVVKTLGDVQAARKALERSMPRFLDATSEGAAPERSETPAARDVLAERRRQVEQEGWTPVQDDDYADGQLSMAAACYAMQGDSPNFGAPEDWPWNPNWWKPTNDRRNLVKAGALILADIERLDRARIDGDKQGAQDGGAA